MLRVTPVSVRSATTRSRASSCAASRSCTRATWRCASSTSTRNPTGPQSTSQPRAATGHGVTEAPRGILYHRYRLDADGTIVDGVIVPPTSQNQPTIEHDLWHFVEGHLDLDDAELGRRCEQAIRNYDPCISCATHFLDLVVDRA